MLLYHYATHSYKRLETKLFRGEVEDSVIEEDSKETLSLTYLPYFRHISFFMEAVPLSLPAKAFKGEHPFWKPGEVLYQHEVEVNSCFPGFFKVLEYEEKTDHYYDDSITLSGDAWLRFIELECIKLGYLGNSAKALEKAMLRNKGAVERCYKLLPSRPNFQDIKGKYAATVPHVALYPEKGFIEVKAVKRLTVPKIASSVYNKW